MPTAPQRYDPVGTQCDKSVRRYAVDALRVDIIQVVKTTPLNI